jgi:hypothetical protein
MIFNETDPNEFRAALQAAGFYAKWQDKYGSDTWSLLKKYAGKLT